MVTGNIFATNLTPEIFVYSFATDSQGEVYIMGNLTAQTSGSTRSLVKLVPDPEEDLCFPVVASSNDISIICL